jgi:hypothetical protein
MRSDDERKHHTAYRSHGQVDEEDAPLGGTTVDGRGALIRRVLQGRWLLEARAVGYSRDSLHCSRGAVHREGIGSPLPDNLVAAMESSSAGIDAIVPWRA